jgi:hypothetical protein
VLRNLRGRRLDVPRAEFYPTVLRTIAELPPEDRDWLRGMVDWSEEYDP